MELSATHGVVCELKALKSELNLSIKDIDRMLQARGDFISQSSLRRVFAENSETASGFSYERTLRPIAQALIAAQDAKKSGPSVSEVALLKSMLYLKAEEIDRLKERLEEMRNENTRLISALMDQIEKKDRRMDEKDVLINKLLERTLQ